MQMPSKLSTKLSTKFHFHMLLAFMLILIMFAPIVAVFSQLAQQPPAKPCPVRIVSHRILTAANQQQPQPGSQGATKAPNIWRHFSTDKNNIYSQQQHEQESTVEMPPPGQNNSALLYSEHYEPDSESSLTANFKCQFIFIGATDERVQIIFHWFRLRLAPAANARRQQNQTELRCEESDHLSAHVLLDDRMSKIVDFCGDELPAQLMSAKNVLTLTYVLKSALMRQQQILLDSRQQAETEDQAEDQEAAGEASANWRGQLPMAKAEDQHGWIAEYRFLTDFGTQPAEAIAYEHEKNNSCSFLFNGTLKRTGNVWSPNYPGFYPRNVDCQYTFIGAKEQIVLVTFEYFDVEGYGQCDDKTQSDFVLFSNYKTRDRTNRRFCGSLRPKGAVQSESNYFRMLFHSNDIFDGTGFYARYQFFNEKTTKNRVKMAPSSGAVTVKDGTALFTFFQIFLISCFFHLFNAIKI